MALSTQEQILIEQQVTNEAKSVGAAYLLWLFLGSFGAHRFYLGKTGTGVAQLLLLIFGWLTLFIVVGGVLLIALSIWWIVDAFMIPGIVAEQKSQLRHRLSEIATWVNQPVEEPKRTVIPGHV
ncbi:TM2 domain-containing protein [Rhizobium sp. P38BS-XIX]|uniref:TM2 domain-containing protein n=1 Tax=Rhizobium sp. P38BS-XIX TaxID=2726740 RepID=UPI001456B17E|nr:TM2 domain-containing protein [Rhizobium sp. P38BS-XIX]NLR98847.1 TM2 domain-containing protein [Rhizobium sp. P38BS-XIX]